MHVTLVGHGKAVDHAAVRAEVETARERRMVMGHLLQVSRPASPPMVGGRGGGSYVSATGPSSASPVPTAVCWSDGPLPLHSTKHLPLYEFLVRAVSATTRI